MAVTNYRTLQKYGTDLGPIVGVYEDYQKRLDEVVDHVLVAGFVPTREIKITDAQQVVQISKENWTEVKDCSYMFTIRVFLVHKDHMSSDATVS